MERFEIGVPDEVLADLRSRLDRTRWPDEIAGSGWAYGAGLAYMKELMEHWRTRFDWRAREAELNAWPQFRATIDGVGIHFLHVRGKGPKPMPLVMTHGWPGSFWEFLKVLPLLTDPASHGGDPRDAFDVVVPSIPGFAFSDKPAKAGMSVWRVADLWARLMTELGYERFAAQGGDFGAGVTTALGLNHAERLIGIHLNYIPGTYRPPPDSLEAEPLSEEEKRFLADADAWWDSEGGYAHVLRRKPLTLAYGLNDSPAGLAAWIVEKFRDWSDCGGDVERCFSKDELLTNVTIYWATQTIHSSMRLYVEGRLAPMHFPRGARVRVPCGIAVFPEEAPFPPRRWVERGYDVQRWTIHPRGGHFAAMEEPELLATDLRGFFARRGEGTRHVEPSQR